MHQRALYAFFGTTSEVLGMILRLNLRMIDGREVGEVEMYSVRPV